MKTLLSLPKIAVFGIAFLVTWFILSLPAILINNDWGFLIGAGIACLLAFYFYSKAHKCDLQLYATTNKYRSKFLFIGFFACLVAFCFILLPRILRLLGHA